MMDKTPFDLKILSIFFFWSAFAFMDVNTNYNYFLGYTVTGLFSKIIWAVSSMMLALGAVGLWKRNLKILKLLIAYFIFSLGDYILWFLYIPIEEKALIIQTDGTPHDLNQTTTTIFFIGFTMVQIILISYLYKRKKGGGPQKLDNVLSYESA